MKPRQLALGIIIIGVTGTGAASETAVYESLTQVTVGRVFFTADERARLDARRGNGTVQSKRRPQAGKRTNQAKTSSAAGYFVDDDGQAWLYKDGNFVRVAAAPDELFRNDIPLEKVFVTVDRQEPQDDDAAE